MKISTVSHASLRSILCIVIIIMDFFIVIQNFHAFRDCVTISMIIAIVIVIVIVIAIVIVIVIVIVINSSCI